MKARLAGHRHARVCGVPKAHRVSCDAVIDLNVSGNVGVGVTPQGYGPADLQAAYKLPATNADGRTVAVVDAYDLPTAEADLGVYRAKYGLPPCTTGNGCFSKVNQSGGGGPLPTANASWGQEIDLDLAMVSAACPSCKILLVEASNTSQTSLGTAVNTAVSLGASAVSNSYGGAESSSELQADAAYYNHPGVAITASAGDTGFGVSYPAASPYVIAVGGTTLTKDSSSRGFSESAWSGTGSGCSAYEPKPSWQHDTGCTQRTVADISADADPDTGVAVYDSTPNQGESGWLVAGGTSASAPFVAGVYTLSESVTNANYPAAAPYAHTASLWDVTSGANGVCSPAYLCTAVTGFDGPTGLGTPDGSAAFSGGAETIDPATPSAPTAVTATAGTDQAVVSWSAPADDGGSPVVGYVVTPIRAGVAMPAHSFTATATTQTLTGLTAGVSYTFTVAAVNAVGRGATSDPSAAVIPTDPVWLYYQHLGGAASYLGTPLASEVAAPRGGLAQDFHGGTIYWSPATGAHAVQGGILAKYKGLGGPAGVLGYPITDQINSPDKVGRYTNFAAPGGASIYWSPATAAHDLYGPIRTKWVSLGAEHGPLGYPKLDEAIAPDGVGRQSSFAGAGGPYLYWSPSTGAHEVVGVILAKYRAAGGPKSLLRYPTSDQAHTTRNVGLENHFTLGSIYWSPPTGAHIVPLLYQNAWAALGWEHGWLGYPTSDEYAISGGRRINFQHGYLTYNAWAGRVIATH